MRIVAVSIAAWACMKNSNQSLHRSPDVSVTRLARAIRAPATGAGELNR
jgi:hypothetical protein